MVPTEHPERIQVRVRLLPLLLSLSLHSYWVTLLSFPATLAALLLHLVRSSLAPTLIHWLTTTWIGGSGSRTPPRGGWWLRALSLAALSSALTAYLALGIVLNLAYPLRPDATSSDWGGPTLPGRWAVHAIGGILFAALAMWLLPTMHALANRWLAERRRSSSAA